MGVNNSINPIPHNKKSNQTPQTFNPIIPYSNNNNNLLRIHKIKHKHSRLMVLHPPNLLHPFYLPLHSPIYKRNTRTKQKIYPIFSINNDSPNTYTFYILTSTHPGTYHLHII